MQKGEDEGKDPACSPLGVQPISPITIYSIDIMYCVELQNKKNLLYSFFDYQVNCLSSVRVCRSFYSHVFNECRTLNEA